MTIRRSLPICGPSGSAELDEMVHLVSALGTWDVIRIGWPDEAALEAARASAVGYIMVGGADGDTSSLLTALARRDEETPLVVVGDDPSPSARPSAWLRTPPPPSILGALLAPMNNGVSSAPPASVSWRRKTDMIIGNSPQIRQLLQSLDRVASSSAAVLVTGESGTGKELVARALHFTGPRARAPFIAVNCAAIPENLFEAELFGYQRGAFTGAVASRQGAFEGAHQGTLFLDEIGELPLAMQPKLLRVLETGQVCRLGSNELRTVSVRVVAATNRDLEEAIAAGRFREDLYYRLRVFPVHVPPLRDRLEDIPPIVSHHLALIAAREKRPIPGLTSAALEKLVAHPWRGNVRELINALERAFVLGNPIEAEHVDLPAPQTTCPPGLSSYRVAKALFEEDYYAQLLRITAGNVTFAAKLSKKTRKEIYDALKRIGLDAAQYRPAAHPAESEDDADEAEDVGG